MEENKEVTYESHLIGMIWRENVNGPINWFLEEVKANGYSKGAGLYYCRGYGSVAKHYTGKFTTNVPKPYDPETDSDAYSVGEFDALEEAMRAVEQVVNHHIFY